VSVLRDASGAKILDLEQGDVSTLAARRVAPAAIVLGEGARQPEPTCSDCSIARRTWTRAGAIR
jgi:hypothetical protein